MENGNLLALASTDFSVSLTADQNLQFQQNLATLPIAVIVLVSSNSTLESIRSLIPEILATLVRIQPRSLVQVSEQRSEPRSLSDLARF